MSGLRSVEATLNILGVNIELIEYRWNEPTDFSNLNSLHTLSRLIAPSTLFSRMRIGDCDFIRGEKVLFIPAGLPVFSHTARGHAKFGLVQFSPERFSTLTGHDQVWDPAELKCCGDIRSPQLDQLIQRLLAEAAAPGFASDILVDALSVAAMIELARYLGRARSDHSIRAGGLASWQIRRLTDFVESGSHTPVLVADLAKLCGISAGHLQRAFKQATGRTLHNYIEEVRLMRARSLLMTTDLPIKQIAGQLGFANPSGFTIAFRRVAGETPGSFRRRRMTLN